MIILVSLSRKLTAGLLIGGLLFGCLIALFFNFFTVETTSVTERTADGDLKKRIKQIFVMRNQALLAEDKNKLQALYDREVKKGAWAYEHELKKMKYLHNWSAKQGVKFTKIKPEVVIRKLEKEADKLSVSLMAATTYQYVYEGAPHKYNSFRIGTYHVLDLKTVDNRLAITKEWYTDPFADSLHLDKMKNQEIKELILAGEPKDLSGLDKKRLQAVKYTTKYCGAASPAPHSWQYNYDYKNYNYQGGDCANFASQMLYEGGGFKKNGVWNYSRGSGTKAWVNAQAFNQYMVSSGRGSVIARGSYRKVLADSYKLLPGDYIAYEEGGEVKHISVVAGFDSKGYVLVNSHNTDRYRVPWDLGWNNKEIKFWLVRVDY